MIFRSRRPPRGGRGLKFLLSWAVCRAPRRPPRGGRGLKCTPQSVANALGGRPPRGGRGLKSRLIVNLHTDNLVAPLAGGVD